MSNSINGHFKLKNIKLTNNRIYIFNKNYNILNIKFFKIGYK